MKSNNALGVSVIIPVFNGARYIRRALFSVLAQDSVATQIIVVDGASTDDTVLMAKSLLRSGDIIISESDEGQLDAVRKGMALATMPLCYWLNADDLLAPAALTVVVAEFEKDENLNFLFSDNWVWDEASKKVFVGQSIRRLLFSDHLFYYRQIYSECVFWRRSLNDQVRWWDVTLRAATDYALTLQLQAAAGPGRKWLNYRLGIFTIVADGDQISRKFRSRVRDEQSLIKRNVSARMGMSESKFCRRKRLLFIGFHFRNTFMRRWDQVIRVSKRFFFGDSDRFAVREYILKIYEK